MFRWAVAEICMTYYMKSPFRVLIIAALFCGLLATPAKATEVVGNNETAAYIGTGGLLLPSSFSGGGDSKTAVANCASCTWAYTVFCMYDAEGLCQHSVSSCPAGEIKYRVWFGISKSTLSVIGSVCWGSGKPPTRADVERRISDLVITYVPSLELNTAPPDGSLTVIPVIAWVNQAREFNPSSFQLVGRQVSIHAFANWRWIWGDGNVEWKSVPGAPYPSKQISHLYRIPGVFNLNVTTFWQATYDIEGIGSFATGGQVLTQSVTQELLIKQGRSVLVK
jgi:hypothetical protein